jgi:hypothetical protein
LRGADIGISLDTATDIVKDSADLISGSDVTNDNSAEFGVSWNAGDNDVQGK